MDDFLYLDTARVGRPSLRTLHAATDSLLLAAKEGGSAYFDRFLAGGLAECPAPMQSRYPGLLSWRGVASLKADLRKLVGVAPDLPVLLANRSTELMSLAALLFFPRCRNVLTCDLGWPTYQSILERQSLQSSSVLTVVPLRRMVFGGGATADEVVETVSRIYMTRQCDGLFLPAVSHRGVRLPIERIVRSIEARCEVRLVVVDGAQEFCHVESELTHDYCDLYLTGCHKWLGAHHPMGLGFYGRRRTRGFFDTMLGHFIDAGIVDDPLLLFEQGGLGKCRDPHGETVNISALFTCQAAVCEALEPGDLAASLAARMQACESVGLIAADVGWYPEPLDRDFHSAILLVRPRVGSLILSNTTMLRTSLREHGIGATVYNDGLVRLSFSESFPSAAETDKIRRALQVVA